MNETLKQNRLLMEQGDDRLFTNNLGDKDNGTDLQKNVSIFLVKWIHILMFFSDIKTFPWQGQFVLCSLLMYMNLTVLRFVCQLLLVFICTRMFLGFNCHLFFSGTIHEHGVWIWALQWPNMVAWTNSFIKPSRSYGLVCPTLMDHYPFQSEYIATLVLVHWHIDIAMIPCPSVHRHLKISGIWNSV